MPLPPSLARMRSGLAFLGDALASRVAAKPIPERELPFAVNLAVHTEHIAEASLYGRFLDFARAFRTRTGVPLLACVTTPECPWVALQMGREGVGEREYADRLRGLAEVAEIGYHGHFFLPTEDRARARRAYAACFGDRLAAWAETEWEGSWIPVSHHDPDDAAVLAQMDRELAWLRSQGHAPTAYVAGWWHLTAGIVLGLEARGFRIDCSVRRRHTNTFGRRYLPEAGVPAQGEVAPLPPATSLQEVQSLFYPVCHPAREARHYAALAAHRPGAPLAAVLPAHETEIVHCRRAVLAHVDFVSSHAAFRWMPVSGMPSYAAHPERAGGAR